MKLSVCIPTYNRLGFLLILLEQLRKVQFSSFEIIIGDDSTNNETEEYFKINHFPGVKYFRNYGNLGEFKNCNACLARAQGEWVQVINDDDQVDPAYLSAIVPLLENKDAVLITGKTIFEGDGAEEIKKLHQEKLERMGLSCAGVFDGARLISNILLNGNPFVFSHTLFRRETAISHSGFDNNLGYAGDINLWLRILRSGNCIISDAVMGKYIVHHSNSLAGKGKWNLFAELWHEKLYYAGYVKNNCAANQYPAYINELRKQFPAAIFIAGKILKRKELCISIKELVKQNHLSPYPNARGILFSVLNLLPQPLAAGTYHLLKKN